jgi:hypothetical protein
MYYSQRFGYDEPILLLIPLAYPFVDGQLVLQLQQLVVVKKQLEYQRLFQRCALLMVIHFFHSADYRYF